MTNLEQQIEEAILSTLVVENKESIVKYCVPKIMAIVEKWHEETRFDNMSYGPPQPPMTSKEIGYLDGLTAPICAYPNCSCGQRSMCYHK